MIWQQQYPSCFIKLGIETITKLLQSFNKYTKIIMYK